MLWYKAWLETRVRFLISLVGITALCAYRVYDPTRSQSWTQSSYYYFTLRSGQGVLQLLWLVAVTLLMMGGLLQEKANGSAAFTLGLPVSRGLLMNVRVYAGLIQSALLIAVPWAAMYATYRFMGPARPMEPVLFYAVVLAGGGAVFVGASLLISSLVEGAYTAPMISAGILLVCVNAPKSLSLVNPMAFMSGRAYLAPDNLTTGPVPWGPATAYFCVAALLIAASLKAVERRDF